jgi:ABC-type lipoprotein release transport system permease subunit
MGLDESESAAILAALFAVTLAATMPPVLRSLRIDPITALRHQ